MRFSSLGDLLGARDVHLGYSEWLSVHQDRVQRFADATDDWQWIHVDPARAAADPFGATAAHGFLSLPLAPRFLPELLQVDGVGMVVNYGLARVRFPSPLLAGSR
jgi:acyl dehydratase